MLLISLPENVLQMEDNQTLETLCASVKALGGKFTYNAPYAKRKRAISPAVLAEILAQVHKATGLSLEEIVQPKRATQWIYARLLLAALATQKGYSVEDTACLLQRSAPSVYRLLQQYRNESKFNPEFKKIISGISS